jgi:regulator of sigma E protease
LTALWLGVRETWFLIDRTLVFVRDLFMGRGSVEDLGGPIRIAEVSGQAASISLMALLSLTAVLSVSIGLLNLFPIPMLDGGHLVFYTIEALRGRPLSERSQEIGFRVGLALVLTLMVVATWNDIARLVAS